MRSPPAHSRLSRRTLIRAVTGAGVGLVVGAVSHGMATERHHVGLTRADFPLRGLPPALAGLRVGLITDTHHSVFTGRTLIDDAVRLLQRQAPDVIVLGGDYVTQGDRAYISSSAEAFAVLSAPLGVYGVLGNHDDDVEMPRALRRNGVTVLRDARLRLTTRGEVLDLIGLRYWTNALDLIAPLARGRAAATLLLAHDPRRLKEATSLRIPGVIAGHTHGGQIGLPLIGALATRKYPVAQGLTTRQDTTLFVSRGVGTVYVPCRINCPPEVVVLTLRVAAPPLV